MDFIKQANKQKKHNDDVLPVSEKIQLKVAFFLPVFHKC